MVTPNIALRLVAATVLLGSVAVAGSAMAAPTGEATLAANTANTSVPPSVAVTAPVAVNEPGTCTRKVKVIYAGYGEAARAGCIGSSTSAAK